MHAKALVVNHERKRLLEIHRLRWENRLTVKVDLKKIRF